jgi:hypothetical protein
MAGNQNSGGNRPSAAQNNPASINPMGGNGQSGAGQPTMYIPGMKSLGSTGESTMAQQSGATMYSEANNMPSMPASTPLTAPTNDPNQPITHGAPVGAGANMVAGLPKPPTGDPDIDMIRNYYPILEFWASQPGSSQGAKDYVQYLGTIL